MARYWRKNLLVLGCAVSCACAGGCASRSGEPLAEPTVEPGGPGSPQAAATTEAPSSSQADTATASSAAQTSAETAHTDPRAAAPVCDESLLRQTPGWEGMTFLGRECTSEFQEVGKIGTEWLAIAHWDGEKWQAVKPDGSKDGPGETVPCWRPGKLRSMGVPEEIVRKKAECGAL